MWFILSPYGEKDEGNHKNIEWNQKEQHMLDPKHLSVTIEAEVDNAI